MLHLSRLILCLNLFGRQLIALWHAALQHWEAMSNRALTVIFTVYGTTPVNTVCVRCVLFFKFSAGL